MSKSLFGSKQLLSVPNILSPKGASKKSSEGKHHEDDQKDNSSNGDKTSNPSPNASDFANGAGMVPPSSSISSPKENIHKIRRRLSVTSDNKLIEGVEQLQVVEQPSADAAVDGHGVDAFIVSSYAGHSKKGYAPYNTQKKNQDALLMMEDSETQTLVLSVLDGHGEFGDGVAQFIRHELEVNLFRHPLFGSDIRSAITETIHNAEQRMFSVSGIDTDFSGSTLVLAAIRGRRITIANVGDSRIILSSRPSSSSSTAPLVASELSFDHKPDLPAEKARILAAGGRVFAVEYDDGIDGPQRVWLGHMDVPGLAMSRSLGDVIAHTAGVSSIPDIFERVLDPALDAMLIVASDGLWEFCSNEDVTRLAGDTVEPSAAVNILIKEAQRRWMAVEKVVDDTTVCVAFLQGK